MASASPGGVASTVGGIATVITTPFAALTHLEVAPIITRPPL
jgi:hypothetical protein